MVLFVPDCRSPDTQDFSRVTLFSPLRQIQPADHIPNVLYDNCGANAADVSTSLRERDVSGPAGILMTIKRLEVLLP